MKTVSIVVITYNGERFLREQLDSLIAQTYPIHEIVIQDDGSKDGTWAIMEEYAARYAHVHIYHNEAQHGVNGNLYSALARATGELLAICDQDDIWEPQKIEQQVELIGDKMLIGGTTMPFSEDGSPIRFDRRTANCNVLRLLFASAIPGHTMLMRSELLQRFKPVNNREMLDEPCYDIQLQIAAAAMESLVYQGVCPVHQRRFTTATTYVQPINNTRSLTNGIRYVFVCIKTYFKVRYRQKYRMKVWQSMLESINTSDTTDTTNTPAFSHQQALKMTRLMQYSGLFGLLKLLPFCYKNRRVLFYVEEKDSLTLKIRSLLFPLLTVYYFRDLKR